MGGGQAVPGVGRKAAEAVARAYPTLRALCDR